MTGAELPRARAVGGRAGRRTILAAMAPSVTASQFHGQTYAGGSMSLETAASWLVLVAAQERRLAPVHMVRGLRRLPGAARRAADRRPRRARERRPADLVPRGACSTPRARTPTGSRATSPRASGTVEAPVQLVGGWYDIFLPWMVEDFVALRRAGRAPQLIIGPWAHTSPGLMGAGVREGLAWLRAHLLGDDRLLRATPGARLRDRSGPRLARAVRLAAAGGARAGAGTSPARGRLTEHGARPDRSPPPEPLPLRPGRPDAGARRARSCSRASRSSTTARSRRAPTSCRSRATPARGRSPSWAPCAPRSSLRSSLAHHDVFVRLCDVDAAGVSRNVCDALVRVEPGRFAQDADGVSRVTFELWPTAHRFAAGHRLRALVASGAHPRYARNTGTGEPLATAAEARGDRPGGLPRCAATFGRRGGRRRLSPAEQAGRSRVRAPEP